MIKNVEAKWSGSMHDSQIFMSLHYVIDLPVVSLYTVKLYSMINILFPPIATETLNWVVYYHRRVRWLLT